MKGFEVKEVMEQMNGFKVKEAMEQVHISPKMQKEIIMNIQNNRKNETKRAWNWKKAGTFAAAFVLTIGAVSFPVGAFVSNVLKERMEDIPREEIQEIGDMVQGQAVAADGFSREYSDTEKERSKALWQDYENGKFPEKDIAQADTAKEASEGTLCYIKDTSVFNLPAQEMTDEEMLEIIDFQHKMEYALTQSSAVSEEEKAKYKAEEARLEKIVQDAGGITGEEAVEIGKKQLKADLGEKGEKLELMTDRSGSGAQLMDISEDEEMKSKAGVIYDVGFGDPENHSTYGYIIDAVDGSILDTWEYTPE